MCLFVGNVVNRRKFSQNSCFICGMQQMNTFELYMFRCKCQAWELSGKPTYNLLNFPSMKLLYHCLKLLYINLFTRTWFRIRKFVLGGAVIGKSWYYRSCNPNSAKWCVKDSMAGSCLLQGGFTTSSVGLTHWSPGVLISMEIDWYLQIFWCACPQINVMGPHWWQVNIGSGNGLVPSCDKPLPEPLLTPLYVAI